MDPEQEGTSGVNINRRARRVKVSADGTGLVSRAGTLLLRELTVETGLAAGWTRRSSIPKGPRRRVICRGGCWRTWR